MLTVGLSVYKDSSSKHLDECLNSVLINQVNIPDKIIMVIDGLVPADIMVVIDKYYSLHKERFSFIYNEGNRGLTYSLNRMINETSTEYFARMDSDDVCDSKRFKRQLTYLQENQHISILGSQGFDIDNNSVIIGRRNVPITYENIKNTIKVVNPIIHPSVMFRTSAIKHLKGYNEVYRTSQDYELWFRAISRDLILENLEDRLIYYRRDTLYTARKNLKYRLNDVRIKFNGFRLLNAPLWDYIFCITPLLIYFVPNSLFDIVKKIDPRNND